LQEAIDDGDDILIELFCFLDWFVIACICVCLSVCHI
jgi:hypothetical protein